MALLRSVLSGFLWLAALPVVLGSLAALGGPWHWSLLLATHFRPQMALAALLLGLFALPLRQHWTAAVLALCLLANGWPLATAWQAKAAIHPAAVGQPLRVVAYNVYYGNDRIESLAPELLALDADLILLTEVLPRQAPLIEALTAAYPYHALPGAAGSQGEALFSRLPLGETVRRRATESASLWIVQAEFAGQPLELLLGHPLPATNGHLDEVHRRWFAAATEALAELPPDRLRLVMGDLNATPWSSRLAALLDAGALRWTGDGLGTWPSNLPRWLSLPIDQVLVSPGFAVTAARIVTWPGSDHRALVVDLRLPMQE